MAGRRDRQDEILKDFDRFFRKVQEMDQAQQVPEEPLVWGYAYLRGPDGQAHLSRFGHLLDEESLARRRSEPLASARTDEDTVTVVVELPGVPKGSIHVLANGGVLKVEAEQEGRALAREIALPKECLPQSAKATFEDGVLTVMLEKAKPVEKLGWEIPVA